MTSPGPENKVQGGIYMLFSFEIDYGKSAF